MLCDFCSCCLLIFLLLFLHLYALCLFMLQLLSGSTFSLTTWPTIFEFTVWLLAETSITILTATKIAKIKAIIDGIITIIQSPEFMVLVYSQAQNTINKLFMYRALKNKLTKMYLLLNHDQNLPVLILS